MSFVESLSDLRSELAATQEGREDPISPYSPHPPTVYTGAGCTENEKMDLSKVIFDPKKVSV